MAEPYFDNKKQLERIKLHLIKGEILYSVLDLKGIGTGFLGITDRRVIFYDQAFLSKKKAVVSIPYKHIIAVASADEGLLIPTNDLSLVTAAGAYTFHFLGADKSHYAYTSILTLMLQKEETKVTIVQPDPSPTAPKTDG